MKTGIRSLFAFVIALSCSDPTAPEPAGMLITIRTTGSDFPLGYQLQIDDRSPRSIDTNVTELISRLQPRNYSVSLTGVAPNCSVAGGSPSVVSVTARMVTPVVIDVVCSRTDKRIAFVLDTLIRGELVQWILTSDASGGNIVPIVRGQDPSWSHDGRILFSTAVCDWWYATCNGGLEIIDPDTRARSVVESGQAGVNPAWSPDGETFAFSKGESVGTLYTAKLNLTAVRLDGPFTGRHPAWSPDGSRIAFTCDADSGRTDICSVQRDGSQFSRLTSDTRAETFFARPSWSPDGERIALETKTFTGFSDVALMASDGTGITRVTHGATPSWSPDGSRLIFARNNGLYAVNPDGSAESRITNGRHRSPVWRR